MNSSKDPRLESACWDESRLDADRVEAIEIFRRARMQVPLQHYMRIFDDVQSTFELLLALTSDLSELEQPALQLLTDPRLLKALCYLSGPPISLEDLKILADTRSISPAALRANPALAHRLIATVREGLDRKRFPWVAEARSPTGPERQAALIASAAVLTSSRVATERLVEGESRQEEKLEHALLANGFRRASTKTVTTPMETPRPGEFSREAAFIGRRADFLIGLWDTRVMPLDCKVSNSAVNSYKRLTEAAAKAASWTRQLGTAYVVPAAVLSGVYHLRELREAQQRGLTLFWSHNLIDLTDWVSKTRS